MFDNEIAVNEFQLGMFAKIAADLAEETLFESSPGHGHPPVWILGHLAVTGEMGQKMLGGNLTHREWLTLFGPGSSDQIAASAELTKDALCEAVDAAYEGLRDQAAAADPRAMELPHGISLFDGTPIETIGQFITLLLTNHVGFHLGQLSSCRRAAGHPPLF